MDRPRHGLIAKSLVKTYGRRTVVAEINDYLAPRMAGLPVGNQAAVDQLLMDLDGTPNKERLGANANIRLASLHANAEQDARTLMDMATKQFKPVETVFSAVSPVVGTHAGPGTLGLAYMAGGD